MGDERSPGSKLAFIREIQPAGSDKRGLAAILENDETKGELYPFTISHMPRRIAELKKAATFANLTYQPRQANRAAAGASAG